MSDFEEEDKSKSKEIHISQIIQDKEKSIEEISVKEIIIQKPENNAEDAEVREQGSHENKAENPSSPKNKISSEPENVQNKKSNKDKESNKKSKSCCIIF